MSFSNSTINRVSVENVLQKLDLIKSPIVRDVVLFVSLSALMGVAASYHFVQCSLKSIPVVVKLALSSIPLEIAKRSAEYLGNPTLKDLQDHAKHGFEAITLAVAPFEKPSLPNSKDKWIAGFLTPKKVVFAAAALIGVLTTFTLYQYGVGAKPPIPEISPDLDEPENLGIFEGLSRLSTIAGVGLVFACILHEYRLQQQPIGQLGVLMFPDVPQERNLLDFILAIFR
ncbi:MAG: hypothetical protein Q8K75_09250 [Chlamydiales bacterium]|nr:hypothetical protein [Chlamydiales bacterium]